MGLDPVIEQSSIQNIADALEHLEPGWGQPVRESLELLRERQLAPLGFTRMLAQLWANRLPGGSAAQRRARQPVTDAGRVVDRAPEQAAAAADEGNCGSKARWQHVIKDLTAAQRVAEIESASNLASIGAGQRDLAMADNVVRVIHDDPDVRVMVWAHNGHIATDAKGRHPATLGAHLRSRLGRECYALGLFFTRGCFQA